MLAETTSRWGITVEEVEGGVQRPSRMDSRESRDRSDQRESGHGNMYAINFPVVSVPLSPGSPQFDQ